MRIWLQSATSVGRDPFWEDYKAALIKHAEKVARPGTEIELHGVEVMTPGINRSHYIGFLNTHQIINNAIRAEKEGYDAFALTYMLDAGFFELREVVDIPVAFSLESCCHLACLLAPKFALLAMNETWLQRLTERVKHYGLGERLIPSRCYTSNVEVLKEVLQKMFQSGFSDTEPVLKGVREVVRKAAEQGADILIPTPGMLDMILVGNGIKQIEELPLIDTMGTVIKMAEFLVDLKQMGVERVNRGLYTRLAKEELTSVRKLYKVE